MLHGAADIVVGVLRCSQVTVETRRWCDRHHCEIFPPMETLGSAGDHPTNQAAHVAKQRNAMLSQGSSDTARRLRRLSD